MLSPMGQASQGSDTDSASPVATALALCRGAVVSTGIFSFVINLLMLTGPLFMLQVYDRVLSSRSVPTLIALTVLIAGLFAFMGLLELVRTRVLTRIGQRLNDKLASSVFDGVISLGLVRGASSQTQPLRDLDTMRQFLSGPGPLALFDMPWMPLYLAVIYGLHVDLGLLATAGGIVLVVLAVINESVTREPMAEASKHAIAAHAFADEGRRNADVIQALGMRSAIRGRWRKLHDLASIRQTGASDAASTISSASKALRMFLQSAMLALGAYLAVLQEVTPGTIIAGSILMARALAPVDQAIAHWRGFLGFRRANERLKKLLEGVEQAEDPMPLPEPKAHLSVQDLSVGPPGERKPIVQGLEFTLEAGTVLGVIGPTGAGKSTLARALVGVWAPLKGSVAIDSAPFHLWNHEQIGKFVGYLPQEVALFAGTIEDNIGRFASDASPERIVEAAKAANVHDLILKLPAGYSTKIGEGGAALSAGQRQRIALARALYGEPKFVVLDEPNSNLDADGEAALADAIKHLKANGSIVVVIAHRRQAIWSADLLLYIRDGFQVAFGPRDEILSKVLAGGSGDKADQAEQPQRRISVASDAKSESSPGKMGVSS
ncbi:MAG: type I secretion system permease/ATPase [Pseudomonadota bacterium]